MRAGDCVLPTEYGDIAALRSAYYGHCVMRSLV